MLKKDQTPLPPVAHNYFGNTNVITAAVDSSTIIAGNGNTISTMREDSVVERQEEAQPVSDLRNTIFISHRSTDKAIADMLLDFLVGTGIPRNSVFCSSLPGNDIREKISAEVKGALHSSVVNFAILSKDYYESAYCLNEAGVLWFLHDSMVIPIALPEITHDKMIGFLNDEYKTRKLDNGDDISYIYDSIVERLHIPQAKATIIREETHKLIERYEKHLSQRE